MYEIKNMDCFDYLHTLENNSIDFFLLDLPYGQTANQWDIKIDFNKMWDLIKLKISDRGQIAFFTTTRFGVELINSNPSWFRYDLVWNKSKGVGFLSANKMQMRSHEMIYIFSSPSKNISQNNFCREYSKLITDAFNITNDDIKYISNNPKLSYFIKNKGGFTIPDEVDYDLLINHYNIDKIDFYVDYDTLKLEFIKSTKKVYNPQKTKGEPYIRDFTKDKPASNYGFIQSKYKKTNNGDRCPVSVLNFKRDNNNVSLHPTQKPILLLEYLIKTYTNEGDNVCDFTMGSGSACISCITNNRNFYGCELDPVIYKTASDRIVDFIENKK